jgi:hypothetical protein
MSTRSWDPRLHPDEFGLELLQEFIDTHVFIHDDVLPHWADDADEYARHPLALSPPAVVVDRLAGIGPRYLATLQSHGLAGGTVIEALGPSASTLENLLGNEPAMVALASAIAAGHDISLFYADRIPLIEELLASLSSRGVGAVVHPDPASFVEYNDKIRAHALMSSLGLPVPRAEVLEGRADVAALLRHSPAGVFVKPSHHETSFVTASTLHTVPVRMAPTLVEVAVTDVVASPVTNWIRWGGQTATIGIAEQLLHGPAFAGNFYDGSSFDKTGGRLRDIASTLGADLQSHVGPAGFDSVLTSNGDLYVVDLNLRFNSSTYMFYLIGKLGLADSLVKYVEVACDLESLDELPTSLPWPSRTDSGVIALGPVWIDRRVRRFFAFAAAPDRDQLDMVLARLEDLGS